jgi:hypothetical protein
LVKIVKEVALEIRKQTPTKEKYSGQMRSMRRM